MSKEENNGHYFCVTCSQPTDGFVVTVQFVVRKRMPVCGHKEDPNVWSDIRNMEFHTLNRTPSVLTPDP